MSAFFTQRGGVRLGTLWAGWNMTWPFAQITVAEDSIEISGSFPLLFSCRYTFTPTSVRRLCAYSGLFSRGLRIEHTVADYPPFIVFWTFDMPGLAAVLERRGFRVENY